MRPDPLQDQQQDQRHHADDQRDDGGIRKVPDEAQNVAEKAFLGYVNAEQLRHLIEHDHQPDPGLEAGQHRHRDEVRDETEAKHRSHDEQATGQRRKRRRRGDQPRRGLRPEQPAPSWAATRIASVVVELTLSTRDVPSSA